MRKWVLFGHSSPLFDLVISRDFQQLSALTLVTSNDHCNGVEKTPSIPIFSEFIEVYFIKISVEISVESVAVLVASRLVDGLFPSLNGLTAHPHPSCGPTYINHLHSGVVMSTLDE